MNFSRLFSLPPHSHESNTLAPHRWCSSQITARVENQRKSDNSDLRELKLKHSLTQVYAKLSVHWSEKWEVENWRKNKLNHAHASIQRGCHDSTTGTSPRIPRKLLAIGRGKSCKHRLANLRNSARLIRMLLSTGR